MCCINSLAQASVEATTICYDIVTHDFYPADDASACAEGYIFTNAAWDCYGLLMLTYGAEDFVMLQQVHGLLIVFMVIVLVETST